MLLLADCLSRGQAAVQPSSNLLNIAEHRGNKLWYPRSNTTKIAERFERHFQEKSGYWLFADYRFVQYILLVQTEPVGNMRGQDNTAFPRNMDNHNMVLRNTESCNMDNNQTQQALRDKCRNVHGVPRQKQSRWSIHTIKES